MNHKKVPTSSNPFDSNPEEAHLNQSATTDLDSSVADLNPLMSERATSHSDSPHRGTAYPQPAGSSPSVNIPRSYISQPQGFNTHAPMQQSAPAISTHQEVSQGLGAYSPHIGYQPTSYRQPQIHWSQSRYPHHGFYPSYRYNTYHPNAHRTGLGAEAPTSTPVAPVAVPLAPQPMVQIQQLPQGVLHVTSPVSGAVPCPVTLTCPHCNLVTTTKVTQQPMWIFLILIAIFGFVGLILALLLYFNGSLINYCHFCTHCNNKVSSKKKFCGRNH